MKPRKRSVTKRVALLHEATKIPARAERLVKKWRIQADCMGIDESIERSVLRANAAELEKALK